MKHFSLIGQRLLIVIEWNRKLKAEEAVLLLLLFYSRLVALLGNQSEDDAEFELSTIVTLLRQLHSYLDGRHMHKPFSMLARFSIH